MAEQINKNDYINHPDRIGGFNYYSLGETTIKQLQQNNLISSKTRKFQNKKPDAIVTDDEKDIVVYIENKDIGKLSTADDIQSAIDQEIDVAKAVNAPIFVVTDTVDTYWINTLTGERIISEDGTELRVVFKPNENKRQLEKLIKYIRLSISATNNQLKKVVYLDPTDLATAVHQKIWIAKNSSPETCLYTFVELFIFKYLSDLGVLTGDYSFDSLCKKYEDEGNSDEYVLDFYLGTFTLKKTNLGTLESLEENKYNLILTNPPYVVNGSGDMKALATATGLYKCGGLGLEALFMEWIVKSLAEDGTALIVIPDGILSNLANKKLREYILDRCTIEGIISLPINTFFGTPKKTYILAIKKKYTDDLGNTQKQVAPVFTYICNSIGETLDVYRFDTEENHLEEAVNQYNLFKSTPDRSKFKAISYDEEGKPYIDKKCKLIDIQKFYDAVDTSWIIDNFWSDEEKIELGFKKEVNIMTIPELQTFIDNVIEAMEEYRGDLECLI